MSDCRTILEIQSLCDGSHQHELLQGRVVSSVHPHAGSAWKTSLAGKYPPQLCHRFAAALASISPKG
eukprot:15142972-Alexandrium_andersonii.AAC.1